ncbi:hypothetical protein C4D60_Mb09t23490 [Musa balbisiana]|uniref:Uncharacterized protein n=1 Tax=Musa balbisiana TaxID=52838 RepID=A0A4S8IIH8_MUSBA|nr:hypothetical protein C4D60_Mb09t23490 [Musa balbisiana]
MTSLPVSTATDPGEEQHGEPPDRLRPLLLLLPLLRPPALRRRGRRQHPPVREQRPAAHRNVLRGASPVSGAAEHVVPVRHVAARHPPLHLEELPQ